MGDSTFVNWPRKKWITGNKGNGQPSNLLFFDTETIVDHADPDTGEEWVKLRLGHAVAVRREKNGTSRRKVRNFDCQECFWEFLLSRTHPRLPLWCFAHNLGFDLPIIGFFERLADRRIGFSIDEVDFNPGVIDAEETRQFRGLFIGNDPPTLASCFCPSGAKIIFCDTLNYWRLPLDVLGEAIGYKKMRMPQWTAPDSEWLFYCRRDVEILEKSITGLMDWHRQNNLGNWGITQASMSMNAYRHRFYTEEIEQHENVEVKKLERKAYYGGLLEMFYQGTVHRPVYSLDVNSQYPSVMRREDFPCELICSSLDYGHTKLPIEELTPAHVATVLIKTDDETFPHRSELGTIFPHGEYWTTLCGPELMRAKHAGCIHAVREWSYYRMANLFRDFVDFFYGQRLKAQKNGDKVGDLFAKIFLNSLYGKFGQMTPKWLAVDELPNQRCEDFTHMTQQEVAEWMAFDRPFGDESYDSIDGETGNVIELRRLGNRWEYRTERKEHHKSFPAIAAWVTAYAREFMRHLMKVVGHKNYYYCVTDALFVNGVGLRRLRKSGWIDSEKIGKLEIEKKADSATFRAIHHYELGSKIKFGSRKRSAETFRDGVVLETQFEGLAAHLQKPPDSLVRIRPIVKEFKREYTRGIIEPDGWIVPLRLSLEN